MSKKPLTREEQFLAAISGKGSAPKPLTREEAWLAEVAENAGGTWDDIEGKPFKDGIIEKEALPEALRFGKETVAESIGYIESGNSVELSKAFEAGIEYKVTVDGIEYSVVPKQMEYTFDTWETGYVNYAGNTALYVLEEGAPELNLPTSGEEYPFLLMSYSTAFHTTIGFTHADGETNHTVDIAVSAETTTPLSDEYISENIARVADIPTGGDSGVFVVNLTQDETGNDHIDKAFAEIMAAHESGKAIFLRVMVDTTGYGGLLPLSGVVQSDGVVVQTAYMAFSGVYMDEGFSVTTAYIQRAYIFEDETLTYYYNAFTVNTPT